MATHDKISEKTNSKPQALLLGLAIGDALGVPVEFRPRGSFHVTGMTGHGTHNQPVGTWSDDTSMALCLADALKPDSLDLAGIAERFIAWRDKAAFTAHGETFDIGNATWRAIERLKNGVEPIKAGGVGDRDNGNGSLMRIAPLVFYVAGKPAKERFEITKAVSGITHAHPISVTGCFIYIEMLNLLLNRHAPQAAYVELKENFKSYAVFLDKDALAKYDRILQGDIAGLLESDIRSSGYVVDTLEASLWAFLATSNYKDAVLKAVNLGDDTDTRGAVTGAMSGLYYGLKDIPQGWLDKLAKRDLIAKIADRMQRMGLSGNA